MAQTYKVKLESGRVLGPLDLKRIRLLILKNQIMGREVARVYPSGEWVNISSIPEIADLLVARAAGVLTKDSGFDSTNATRATSSATHILPGATGIFSIEPPPPPAPTVTTPAKRDFNAPDPAEVPLEMERAETRLRDLKRRQGPRVADLPVVDKVDDEERTMIGSLEPEREEDKTAVGALPAVTVDPSRKEISIQSRHETDAPVIEVANPRVSREETVMIKGRQKKGGVSAKEGIKATIAAILLGIAGYQVFLSEPETKIPSAPTMIRPTLPNFSGKNADPRASQKAYDAAMHAYLADNVAGYRSAAAQFSNAASLDNNNVKALALLASSYINLIDASNKDENYFAVLSKLIDMTRAKNVDLPETVIADVEFFCVVNKAEAAQSRIVEYTKTHPSFGLEMFYYLSLAFYTRGDFQNASRYVSQIPDNKVFSAKVFFLEGRIAERLEDTDAALIAYGKAVVMNKGHAKSRLRIADIYNQRGRIAEAKENLEYLVAHSQLLSPADLGLSYYLHSVLNEQNKNFEIALGDAERAVQLNKDDHNYLLQLYSMRAKAGESITRVRVSAKMYYFLGEGERLLKAGKYQDALTQFLQARQSNNDSPIPLVKIGDMFSYLHDLGNARLNYKMAADRAPNSIDIWSKYINVLIQSYEWDEASKAMDRFRQLPVSQSAIDKAAGDMYARQGQFDKAQIFYRKAMARESIDPEVYIAYAKSLMATQNYKEAPFFFALAQRYDPLNIDAIVGTAKSVASSDSIDRAISMLQDELQRNGGSKAELLGAVAEFQIQKGQWEQAQRVVEQAMNANPDYAFPWKLQAQIYMNKEGTDRKALDKALSAYQAYSDRNSSDPSGYLERYYIFVKKSEYDKADDELGKIFSIYPKYPNLHYFKGDLYARMGNHPRSVEEYRIELQNQPNNVEAMKALGKEYIEMGGYSEALAQFNKAMQLQPQSADAKQLSGWANYLLKNFAGAVALYQAALAKDPGNPLTYKRLCLAYRDMGDRQAAAQACQKYLQMQPDAPDRQEIERYR